MNLQEAKKLLGSDGIVLEDDTLEEVIALYRAISRFFIHVEKKKISENVKKGMREKKS